MSSGQSISFTREHELIDLFNDPNVKAGNESDRLRSYGSYSFFDCLGDFSPAR
jgi:hypothetical protein